MGDRLFLVFIGSKERARGIGFRKYKIDLYYFSEARVIRDLKQKER